jgi:hypothetical protein
MPPKNQVQQSSAWEYFDEIDGSKNVKCKKCGEILQRKDSSTSSMILSLFLYFFHQFFISVK